MQLQPCPECGQDIWNLTPIQDPATGGWRYRCPSCRAVFDDEDLKEYLKEYLKSIAIPKEQSKP